MRIALLAAGLVLLLLGVLALRGGDPANAGAATPDGGSVSSAARGSATLASAGAGSSDAAAAPQHRVSAGPADESLDAEVLDWTPADLPPGGVLEVIVRQLGTPYPGAVVDLELRVTEEGERDGRPYHPGERRRALTNAEGLATISCVPGGMHAVHVDTGIGWTHTLRAAFASRTAGRRHEIEIGGSELWGQVWDEEGRSRIDASISAGSRGPRRERSPSESSSSTGPATTTDGAGTWSLGGLFAGTYVVSARWEAPDGSGTIRMERTVDLADFESKRVDFGRPFGLPSVGLDVRDRGGRLVDDATLLRLADDASGVRRDVPLSGGSASDVRLEPGTWLARVRLGDRFHWLDLAPLVVDEIDVEAGSKQHTFTLDGATVVLRDSATRAPDQEWSLSFHSDRGASRSATLHAGLPTHVWALPPGSWSVDVHGWPDEGALHHRFEIDATTPSIELDLATLTP